MRQLCRHMIGFAVSVVCASGSAAAADPLGFYVGGAIGQGDVAANVANPFIPNPSFVHVAVPTSDVFNEKHSAFKVMLGLHPIPLLGAELSYLDLGNPTGSLFGHPGSASMKGASAFGILYLPIPVVDVFAKAGVARIQSTASGFAPNGIPDNICAPNVPCSTSPFQQDRTNTTFAAGAGLQFKFDAWAVRAEYERFNFAGETPHLLSLGLTWSF
jgi:OmpA-OmpF porin, OOP family